MQILGTQALGDAERWRQKALTRCMLVFPDGGHKGQAQAASHTQSSPGCDVPPCGRLSSALYCAPARCATLRPVKAAVRRFDGTSFVRSSVVLVERKTPASAHSDVDLASLPAAGKLLESVPVGRHAAVSRSRVGRNRPPSPWRGARLFFSPLSSWRNS